MKSSVLGLYFVHWDGQPGKPYLVYCRNEFLERPDGYTAVVTDRYARFIDARIRATNAIFNEVPSRLLIQVIADAAGVSYEEAAHRLSRINLFRASRVHHIICPICWLASMSEKDMAEGYCGECRKNTSTEEYWLEMQRKGGK